MNNNQKILEYIIDNFNINKTSMLLISNILDYLYNNSFTYLDDFIEILDCTGIDLTIEELKENNIIE
jgi:hypothetical protein